MDKQYLMGNNNVLTRSGSDTDQVTFISPRLRSNLIRFAMMRAFDFYSTFLGESFLALDYEKLITEYEQDFSHALSLGLLKAGGICEKDHLNLWCLSRAFAPEVYIESGVFIGSSLHAFIKSPKLKKVIAIDPNLSKLKIPKADIPGAVLINDKDFSQLEIDCTDSKSLVYFDDHINTADRILQASQKGLTHLLFDDSTGFEGICQRLYPAVPTIPMIMNCDLLSPGDELSWTFRRSSSKGFKGFVKRAILRNSSQNNIRVSLRITKDFINKCQQAKKRINKCCKILDLGEYIPQLHPGRTADTSKFLIELSRDSL